MPEVPKISAQAQIGSDVPEPIDEIQEASNW